MNINIDSLTCGITDIYYSYEDAVKAAMDGKFKPWSDQRKVYYG